MKYKKGNKPMRKTTLNPFENAKRTREEGGGVSPAIIEEMQAEISVLGSENASQAQDITDIKAQLTELASAYSATEHKTGRKWVDGKDIFEKTFIFESPTSITAPYTLESDTLVETSLGGYMTGNDGGFAPLTTMYVNNGALNISGGITFNDIKCVSIRYTKIGN